MPDFSEIYTEHFSGVYKYVLSLCGNKSISEEITQETFFKALTKIDKFNGKCKLYVWLCQIAKNTYYTHYRKEKQFSLEPEIDVYYQDISSDLETVFLDKEMAKRLHYLLHNLNEPYKEVFSLRIFGELPFSQIGELFNKTDSWARLIFYRAKIRIMEDIK